MKTAAAFFKGNKHVYLDEVDLPDPGADEIQALTYANGICMMEVWQYNGLTFDDAMIPGHEGIGVVYKAGKNVATVKEGDLITASGWKWSKYQNIKAENVIKITKKPDDIDSFLVEPASCVVNACAHVEFYPGDRVIVFGAGYMGLLLAMALKYQPISKLTIVDIKQFNLDLAKKLTNADEFINLSEEGGRKRLEEYGSGAFEISFECSGAAEPLEWCGKLTSNGGIVGVYAWHHGKRTIDGGQWHGKGHRYLNVSPSITVNERRLRSFIGAERLMSAGMLPQKDLVTHKYALSDVERAMKESSAREGNFIKPVLIF